MKFSAREDIEAPVDHVWAQVSDFDAFERQALRRGADVRRVGGGAVQQGTIWDIGFTFRGRDRRAQATLAEVKPPQSLKVDITSAGLDGVFAVDVLQLSATRTRIAVSLELSAKSLSARLVLQSLKLAKGSLSARFKKRVSDFAKDVEARHRA